MVTEDEVQKERSIETIQNQENNNEIPTNSYIRRSHNRMGVFGYLVFLEFDNCLEKERL